MIPILMIAAFGIDFGNVYAQRQAFSSGADSGALAIINQKRAIIAAAPATTCATIVAGDPGFVAASATALAKVNQNAPYGRVLPQSAVTATLSCDGSTLKADVAIDAPVTTTLGGIVGVGTLNGGRNAQAAMSLGGRSKCGLCVIGSGVHDLQNGTVNVYQSGVTINGVLDPGPQGTIDISTTGSDQILLEGPVPTQGHFTPAPLGGQSPITDPLAGLALPPSYAGLTRKVGDPCTEGPGIYGSISLGGSGPCTMTQGLYVIMGEFDIKNRDVTALGTTMYFPCENTSVSPSMPRNCATSGEAGGYLKQAGNGNFTFSAPLSGPTAGLGIVADRNNTSVFTFRGTDSQTSTGTIYIKTGTLDFRGTGSSTSSTSLNSLVVTGNITFSGQPTVDIHYDDNLNIPIPPTPPKLTR